MNYIFIILVFCLITLNLFSQENKCISKLDTNLKRSIYIVLDSMPEYPGGNKAMMEFISNNIKWQQGICYTGTIIISAIVEVTGELINLKIRKGSNSSIDNDALSIIKKMPTWSAGKCNGDKVATIVYIPIRFTLK